MNKKSLAEICNAILDVTWSVAWHRFWVTSVFVRSNLEYVLMQYRTLAQPTFYYGHVVLKWLSFPLHAHAWGSLQTISHAHRSVNVYTVIDHVISNMVDFRTKIQQLCWPCRAPSHFLFIKKNLKILSIVGRRFIVRLFYSDWVWFHNVISPIIVFIRSSLLEFYLILVQRLKYTCK